VTGARSAVRSGSTFEFLRFLVQSFPESALRTSVLTALSSAAEALSVAVLLPVLTTAIGGNGALGNSNPITRAISALFARAGVVPSLPSLVLLVALLMAGKGVFQWLALRSGGRAMAGIATDFRLQTVSNLFRARWSYVVQQRIGTLAAAVGHETYVTAHAYLAMCQLFAAAALALVYAGVIAVVSLPALMLTLFIGVTLVAPLRLILRHTQGIAAREAQAQQAFVGHLLNAVQGIKPIRAMGCEDGFETVVRSHAHELRSSIRRQISLTYLLPAIQEPILVFGIFLFVLGGTYFVPLDFPTFTLVVFGLWRCGNQINFANRFYRELAMAEPYFRQLRAMMTSSHEARERESGTHEVPRGPLTIALEQVSFAHGELPILEGLSMQFRAGTITAIVGASGVGKTTVIDLLLGFHQPGRGRILVNGVPLSDISTRLWRRSIGYVPQETTLFHGTILENVTMGDTTISEADVRAALAASGATPFIDALPQGVQTMVGEQGARFSGGQRQRIAIARALVRRPALLLLDEFTASLDRDTQAAVIETVKAQRPAVTVVLVTHHDALEEIADVVYQLQAKRAAQRVTPMVASQ
jgi:ATP-binding cassette subfamily C protein